MYAVIRAGGKQYKVAEGDLLRVEKISCETGDSVVFSGSELLMVAKESGLIVGPSIVGGKVTALVTRHGRGDKIIVFKKKRRKNYRRKQGHRQGYTELKITDIEVSHGA